MILIVNFADIGIRFRAIQCSEISLVADGRAVFENRPDPPMPAGRAGAAFGVVPAAAQAEAFRSFGFDDYGARLGAGLAPTAPALATGAAFAVDGLAQQVLAALQEAMVWAAGATGPPAPIQPLMPALTL